MRAAAVTVAEIEEGEEDSSSDEECIIADEGIAGLLAARIDKNRDQAGQKAGPIIDPRMRVLKDRAVKEAYLPAMKTIR